MLDLPVDEVARLLGRSAAAVRKLQERGLRSLERHPVAIAHKPLRSRRASTLARIRPAPVRGL